MLLRLARNWWLVVIRGVLAIIFGLLAFFFPGLTLEVLVLLFGAYVLVDGIVDVVSALMNRGDQHWWALLLEGILGIMVGVLVFLWPGGAGLVLLYFIAAWAVVIGILEIVAAIRLWNVMASKWLLLLAGVASVLFGVIAVLWPGAAALAIAWLIAAYALFFGVLQLALGFRLRSLGQRLGA